MKQLCNIDFNYIFSHCDQTKFEIPHYYDRQEWRPGKTYRMRVSNIYDPSKFWIVLKERELEIFQEFIKTFYQKYGVYYKMSLNTISKNMYCVVFMDDSYYRGVIVNIPHTLTLEKKAVVFLLDYGYTSPINLQDIYYLSEKMYSVPRFAIRASLHCLQPYNEFTWNDSVVKRFSELVSSKVLLCILECTDPSRKIVEIKIGIVNDLSQVVDISDILINEKLARTVSTKKEIETMNGSRYSPKTKYPYLFPSFEAIEDGYVPQSVQMSGMLRNCVFMDVLFKPYFRYTGSKNSFIFI